MTGLLLPTDCHQNWAPVPIGRFPDLESLEHDHQGPVIRFSL